MTRSSDEYRINGVGDCQPPVPPLGRSFSASDLLNPLFRVIALLDLHLLTNGSYYSFNSRRAGCVCPPPPVVDGTPIHIYLPGYVLKISGPGRSRSGQQVTSSDLISERVRMLVIATPAERSP